MCIGCLHLSLFIPHSRSLKEKRRVLLSLKQRLKNKFNVSIAEHQSDKWQSSDLLLVCANSSRQCVHEELCRIEEFIGYHKEIQVIGSEKEFL